MKPPRTLLAAFFAVAVLTVTAFADISGNWKWTSVAKSGGTSEVTATFVRSPDGALTGTVTTRQGVADISEGTCNDDVVAFYVTRTVGTQTATFKYFGTVEGDTITGTVERPGPADAPPITTDWKATRVK